MSRFFHGALLFAMASASLAMGGCAADDVELDGEDGEIANESAALGSLEYDSATDHSPFEEATAGRSAEHDTSWGRAFFEKDGDKLWLIDKSSDGDSVGVHWKSSDGRQGICRNTAGRGTYGTKWRKCDKNLPEGATISIRMGRCNGSAAGKTCKVLGDWEGWTGWKSTTVR
jgi:hypothetical protein